MTVSSWDIMVHSLSMLCLLLCLANPALLIRKPLLVRWHAFGSACPAWCTCI